MNDVGQASQRRLHRLALRAPSPRASIATAMVLRLLALFGFHVHSHTVGEDGFNAFPYGGLDDGRYYFETAEILADGDNPEFVLNAFPRVLAAFMQMGVRDLLALKLLSYAMSSIAVLLACWMVWAITAKLDLSVRRWSIVSVLALGTFWPSNIFWTLNSLMRDGWILTFVMLVLWSTCTELDVGRRWPRWVLGFGSLAVLGTFRPYAVAIVVAAVISTRFTWANPFVGLRLTPLRLLGRLLAIAIAFIVGCILVAPLIEAVTGFNIMGWRTRPELLDKGSSLGYGFVDSTPPVITYQYVISLFSNALGPFPWQIWSLNQLFIVVEWPFIIAVAWGLYRADFSSRLARLCGFFGFYWLVLLGLWNDVLGNAARNRIIAWPILAIVAAPVFGQILADWERRRAGDPDATAPAHVE